MARQRPSVNRALGQVLRDLRQARGLSQEALAARCEVHTTYISQLERATKSPTFAMVLVLARALGASGAEFVAAVERAGYDLDAET